ncbi:MAG: DNA repair protein RecN, partial [Phormidesmis sp. CAN_BIN36]|nr:DNA repair protein RecN [Phormidesmis sp. CAN_BIN36]
PTLVEAIAHSQRVQQELAELSGSGQSLEVLEQNYQSIQAELLQACAKLTEQRKQAARQLEALLLKELKPLAMDRVQFKVEITASSPAATGSDRISFVFSPNPGEPLKPMTEIASGGEMSRFLLALKACFSQVDSVGTMVFDEIDVGVSGRVTQAIAEKLHQLSHRHQVLCVTHQPIVAAIADHHFRVDKQVIDPTNGKRGKAKSTTSEELRTVVRVMPLNEHQRREELAQLAGGQSDQEAIAFADSLLLQAANTRSQNSPSLTVASKSTAKTKTHSR